MKKFFYKLYAFFFALCRLLPVKRRRVCFVAPHNGGGHDSLSEMRRYIESVGGFETVNVSGSDLRLDRSGGGAFLRSCLRALRFFTVGAKNLATSKFIFLNDNFMPMASLHFSDEAVITQLWHAEGAFKKFGLSAPLTDEVRRREKACSARLDYVICSSKNVAPVYAEAFGVDESKVLPLGSPRTDILLGRHDSDELRREFDRKHPECAGKKLVLYAPTFRDDPEYDGKLLKNLDVAEFNGRLGGTHALLIKLHPQLNSGASLDGTVDVTSEDIGALTMICDCVVTDYSSVCMDFALLLKPCIFYAFDLAEYQKERSFYYEYEGYVPGRVVTEFGKVLDEIQNPRDGQAQLHRFRDFNFDYIDCGSRKRIFDAVISNNL